MSGCAGFARSPQFQLPASAPHKVVIESVPFYAQQRYQCGPAALAMALSWSGLDIRPDDVVADVYTPGRKGSLQADLITATRQHQRLAYPLNGLTALLQEVAAGHPVVVLQNLGLRWWPRWHYAVVVGYDWAQKRIILHSGVQSHKQLNFKTFYHTWQRADMWGLLTLPVETLPSSAELPVYLKAAFGLQHAGRLSAASRAFTLATQRWPHQKEVWLGLGNVRYAQGNLTGSAEAFQQAIVIDPQCADALNNLAHLLLEQGQLNKAERLARRAVQLGGPHIDLYGQTLEAILKRQQ